ncbi:MAG: glycoside hydrolase family 2 TIM barrel-domain containing protein [Kiritimatiellia bacterium]
MKKNLLLCWISCGFVLAAKAETKIWNRNWEFRRGDMSEWQTCHLPHSFSAPYFLGPDFYTGDGYYRKTLTAEETTAEHLFLDFEAVFQFAEVAVDGRVVARHASGYTGFRADLTPALKRGQAQVVTVKVNNNWDKLTAPRAGEHVFSGGIYRNVRLVSEGAVWIERNGLKVTTPEVSHAEGKVAVRVRVGGRGPATVDIRFADQTARCHVAAPGEVEYVFTQAKPRLWSPESPNLYAVSARVGASAAEAQVGFRWFEFTKDKGFFLNGEHYFLLGANVHQDAAGWGDGVTDASAARDVRMMKEAGFNFIRGSHYPHAKAFLEACDCEGILFWSEGGIWGMGGCVAGRTWWNASCIPEDPADRPAFLSSAETLVREMIDDAFNHPCVIAWSVCNEPFFTAGPPDVQEASRQMVKHLLSVVRACDPTRAAAVGGAQRGGFDALGEDVIGYNGDGARLYRNPPAASLVAEYGSPVDTRPGKANAAWGDFANDRPDWRSGAAIWCGFDHGSIWESGSRMGLVDYFRLPKARWYWYREHLRGLKPPAAAVPGKAARLALETEKSVLRSCDGTDETLLTVRLENDAGALVDEARGVTLRIVSGPGEFPTGRTITFGTKNDIDLRAGLAAIALRAHFAGRTVVRAESEGLAPVEITIDSKVGSCRDADAHWVEGKSLRTPDRPYRGRYKRHAVKEESPVNLALNRPCRASSNVSMAGLASDGDEATAWRPAADDASPWFVQDLEFSFTVTKVEVDGEGILAHEILNDGKTVIRIKLAKGGLIREIKAFH